jgi:hypothetical protein
MTQLQSPHSNPDFDTLLLSNDRILFDQIVDYLRRLEVRRTLKLSHDIRELQPVELWLGKCDIMICDLRFDFSLLQTAAVLVESSPIPLMAVGLTSGLQPPDHEMFSSPASIHLTDLVNIEDGWEDIWRHISNIKHSWNNPLMMSKIEDVPVSDILQMIAIGRWNAMVQIQGRNVIAKENRKKTVERMRGTIFFWNGEPHAAWSSLHVGAEAICDLLSLKQGILRATRPLKVPPFRNIRMDMQDILISFAVTLDESSKQTIPPAEKREGTEEFSTKASDTREKYNTPETGNAVKMVDDSCNTAPQGACPLSPWWSINAVLLKESILSAEPRSLPLRLMKPNDLQKLTHPEAQTGFLVLRAPRQFLLTMLGLCAREFTSNKLDDELIPVMRLGRQQKNYLYTACLETGASCASVNQFPCAVYSPPAELSPTIKLLEPFGHPVVVFLIPGNEISLPGDLVRRQETPVAYTCISAPDVKWDSIVQTFQKILS